MNHVIGRCSKENKILLGGLGFDGVGQMWFPEENHHKDIVGYSDAPEIPYDTEKAFVYSILAERMAAK